MALQSRKDVESVSPCGLLCWFGLARLFMLLELFCILSLSGDSFVNEHGPRFFVTFIRSRVAQKAWQKRICRRLSLRARSVSASFLLFAPTPETNHSQKFYHRLKLPKCTQSYFSHSSPYLPRFLSSFWSRTSRATHVSTHPPFIFFFWILSLHVESFRLWSFAIWQSLV